MLPNPQETTEEIPNPLETTEEIPNPLETTDLVTFTEEILNGKLHFLCSVCFISFKIFVLKTTSMYFDLTYYYYTNLYMFLL